MHVCVYALVSCLVINILYLISCVAALYIQSLRQLLRDNAIVVKENYFICIYFPLIRKKRSPDVVKTLPSVAGRGSSQLIPHTGGVLGVSADYFQDPSLPLDFSKCLSLITL